MVLTTLRLLPMSVEVLAGRGGGGVSGRSLPWSVWILSLLALTSLTSSCSAKPLFDDHTEANIEESHDGCDRILWSTQETRGVHQLSTRCAEGIVSWQQPNGALRVTFHPPTTPSSGTLLETCFSISTHLLKVMVSKELSAVEDGQEVEGLEHLVLLDRAFPRTTHDICVRTKRPLTLFVEAQPGEVTATLGHVRLQYDVTIIKQHGDSLEECRPCTEEELLVKVCSNDFVVAGKMDAVRENVVLKQTTIDVTVDRIYRQKSDHFGSQSRFRREISETKSENRFKHSGTVLAPHNCGIQKGAGDFLFIGRIRLGKALLQCAPRVEEFNKVWRRAVKWGTNPCLLD